MCALKMAQKLKTTSGVRKVPTSNLFTFFFYGDAEPFPFDDYVVAVKLW